MKKFRYKAKDSQGKTVSGLVEAADEKRAVEALRKRGLVVISLSPVQPNIFSQTLGKIFHRISLSEITTFTRQLSTMVSTGLTLNDALNILKNQSSPALAILVDDVLKNVEGGASLADSLARHPQVFSQVYVALVRVGEAAGVLDQVLSRLADNLEKQQEFRAKVKGAMIYPAIVIGGMGVVAAVMMLFVIPKLLALYEEFQAKLPTATLVLMKISHFFVSFWWMGLAVLGGGWWLFRNFQKTPFGRRKIDEIILQLPLIGHLQSQIILTEMTRTLGLLASAGISLIEALKITAAALGNTVFEDRLNQAARQVEKGLPLATTLAAFEEFPPIVPQMISVGEETGKMDEVLNKISRYFEQESEQMVRGLTTAVEPLIMILLGLGVGFLIIAVILPIYNLTSQF